MSNFGKKYDPNKRLRNKILNEAKNSLRQRKPRKKNSSQKIRNNKTYKFRKKDINFKTFFIFVISVCILIALKQ